MESSSVLKIKKKVFGPRSYLRFGWHWMALDGSAWHRMAMDNCIVSYDSCEKLYSTIILGHLYTTYMKFQISTKHLLNTLSKLRGCIFCIHLRPYICCISKLLLEHLATSSRAKLLITGCSIKRDTYLAMLCRKSGNA